MWSDLRYRLRAIFGKREMEDELGEELRFHAEQQLKKSLDAGLTPEEAARRYRLAFGGEAQIQEECRDARGITWVEHAWRDLAYALRVLGKSKGFAAVAVLILALGIGANTAAFSFVNAILLKRLPVWRPDDLVMLRYTQRGRGPFTGMNYPQFRALEEHNDVFSGMLARWSVNVHFTSGGAPIHAYGELVSGHYFETLGVRAAVGRTLTAEDDGVEGAHPVCVISWRFWQDEFGGDPAVLGRMVHIDAQPFQIVGVLQPGFRGLELQAHRDIFVPMAMTEMFAGNKRDATGWTWLLAMGRLKPGVTVAQANSALDVLMQQGPQPRAAARRSVLAAGGQGVDGSRQRLGGPVEIALGAVGLVLLIACANLAGLLLARASARRRELAVRLALGATRRRLIQQLLMECAVLAAGGALASIAVSAALMRLFLRFLEEPASNMALLVGLDPTVLLFTTVLASATVLAFGLLPAWHATRMDAGHGLQVRPGMATYRAGRLRQGLIVVQLALGMVLLFGAGVLTRSLRQLQTADLGFHPERVVTAQVEPGKNGYNAAATGEFYDRFVEQARKIPVVESAALSQIGVLTGNMFAAMVRVPGYRRREEEPNNNYNMISPDYFRTLGIGLVAGRDFNDADREGAPGVAIVNEQFVSHYWPGESVVGRQIGCLGKNVEIVGVVRTARYMAVREDPQITIYLPLKQKALYPVVLQARTRAHGDVVMARLRDIVRGLDARMPVVTTTLIDQRDATISSERMLAFLSGFLALLAAALVAIGLYGIIAYSVAGRMQEIGVRLALGARPADVTWLFVRQALLIAAVGILLGLPPSLVCARFLKSIVFGVPAQDPWAVAWGMGLLGLIAAASALWPSVRGSREDPMKALRCE